MGTCRFVSNISPLPARTTANSTIRAAWRPGKPLTPLGRVLRWTALALPGSWWERQRLGPDPRPSESEVAFEPGDCVHVEVWGVLAFLSWPSPSSVLCVVGVFSVFLCHSSVVGWCWGDGHLCVVPRSAAHVPTRPENSPQLWAWHEENLNKCLWSEMELPTGRQADSPICSADTRQTSMGLERDGCARGLCQEALPMPGGEEGLAHGRSCREICGASGSLADVCSQSKSQGAPSLPSVPCLAKAGATMLQGAVFLWWLSFLLVRDRGMCSMAVHQCRIFPHLWLTGLRLNSVLYWCQISNLLVHRLAQGMGVGTARREWEADIALRTMKWWAELAALGFGRNRKLGS